MSNDKQTTLTSELEKAGFKFAIAIATEAEVQNGAACGQLAIIDTETNDK